MGVWLEIACKRRMEEMARSGELISVMQFTKGQFTKGDVAEAEAFVVRSCMERDI